LKERNETDVANEVFAIVEAKVRSTPSPTEFEMAYQKRVAVDRIRFAIQTTEQPGHTPEQIREAGLQLLDALDRLESAERSFQIRFRSRVPGRDLKTGHASVNGSGSSNNLGVYP
jgi:hypothetical protein